MSPSPQDLGLWVLISIVLIPAVDTVKRWFAGAKAERRIVSIDQEYATAAELSRVEEDLAGRIANVDGDVRALKESIQRNGEERRVRIEGKVEEARQEAREGIEAVAEQLHALAIQVGKVETTAQTTNQSVSLLSEKIDRATRQHS